MVISLAHTGKQYFFVCSPARLTAQRTQIKEKLFEKSQAADFV